MKRPSAALLALFVGACTNGNGGEPPGGYDRNAMLASLGEHVALSSYRAFQTEAQALQTATAAWSDSFASVPAGDDAKRAAAQDAWRSAMVAWQRAELLQFGPAGLSTDATGGEGLRDEIYSWPTVNACRVDQVTAGKDYEAPTFFNGTLVNAYGLDALEYLLFRADAGNDCRPQVQINADGTWAALSAEEIARRRAAYAQVVAGRVVADAGRLVDAWDPAKGNFLAELASAGKEGSDFRSTADAVDEVFAAMFYADLELKDMKLAEPSGLSPACTTETCPEKLESRWAKHSKENVVANLQGLRALFTGGAPGDEAKQGFDDHLAAVQAADFAAEIVTDIDAAISTAEGVEGTFEEAIATEPAKVEAVHAAVKKVTDHLKGRLVTLLNLRVPQEGAADND